MWLTYTYNTSYPAITNSVVIYSDPTNKVKYNIVYQIQGEGTGVGGSSWYQYQSKAYGGSTRAEEVGQKL